jgi:hypothetical protein
MPPPSFKKRESSHTLSKVKLAKSQILSDQTHLMGRRSSEKFRQQMEKERMAQVEKATQKLVGPGSKISQNFLAHLSQTSKPQLSEFRPMKIFKVENQNKVDKISF